MKNETKDICLTCNHTHYKNYSGCPNCNCGESERIYIGSWRGYNPDAMYEAIDTAYERSNKELNIYED